jgi:eukaryotic-like serine/threonine-protein kinase
VESIEQTSRCRPDTTAQTCCARPSHSVALRRKKRALTNAARASEKMHPPERQDPLYGTRYRTLRRLGLGTMGEVFLVEHAALRRRFVAKILHARHAYSEEYLARFGREGLTLGQMRHPNIIAVTDFDTTEGGRPFIVMEYLDGRTLDDELKERGRLPSSEAFVYARQILSALEVAHSKGIVHRDIKPQNLLLHSRAGALPVLKVLDFGAARDTHGFASPAVPHATSTGAVVGTFAYLSPEGAHGRQVDLRADLYSVGLVLAAMLSGHPPTSSARRTPGVELVVADLDLPRDVPVPIAPVILRALAFDAAQRFQSAAEFLAALP